MKKSLRQRILAYLKKNKGVWINGGEIERLAQNVGYKASNASRRLRELHEDGEIQRKEIKGKVWYMFDKEIKQKPQYQVIIKDGQPVAVVV